LEITWCVPWFFGKDFNNKISLVNQITNTILDKDTHKKDIG